MTNKPGKTKPPKPLTKKFIVFFHDDFARQEPRSLGYYDEEYNTTHYIHDTKRSANAAIAEDRKLTHNTVYWIQECE